MNEKSMVILIKPPSKIISTHTIKDDKEYDDLLQLAISKSLLLYHSTKEERNGRIYAKQPLNLEIRSIGITSEPPASEPPASEPPASEPPASEPPVPEPPVPEPPAPEPPTIAICCPYCGKECTSSSGLTLHIKSKHKK